LCFPVQLGWQAHTTASSHWLRWSLMNLLPRLSWNHNHPNPSWVARVIGLSHCAQLQTLDLPAECWDRYEPSCLALCIHTFNYNTK
jgi:hypothetical protein